MIRIENALAEQHQAALGQGVVSVAENSEAVRILPDLRRPDAPSRSAGVERVGLTVDGDGRGLELLHVAEMRHRLSIQR